MGFRKARMNGSSPGPASASTSPSTTAHQRRRVPRRDRRPDKAVKVIVEAAPEAIQLTVGQARLLQDILGPRKPAWCCARPRQRLQPESPRSALEQDDRGPGGASPGARTRPASVVNLTPAPEPARLARPVHERDRGAEAECDRSACR